MRLRLVLGITAALAGCATASSDSRPWPAAGKQALVQECQAQIWRRAENNFLNTHNASRAQLPPNFRTTMNPAVQPSLDACACYMDRLEREWSYEQLAGSSGKLNDKLAEITASGACAPSRR